ncbi:MAG: hypothetical protein ACYTDY_09040 [Planctomycetota bacterium]|jgi:hypothetical protein
MAVTLPELCAGAARIVVVGDCGSTLARGLRDMGNSVNELPPSDFHGQETEMVDVVAVLPDCSDAERVGAVAAACARMVWFQERSAPHLLAQLLAAAGVPLVEGKDLLKECDG